jgi:hypothetical protein
LVLIRNIVPDYLYVEIYEVMDIFLKLLFSVSKTMNRQLLYIFILFFLPSLSKAQITFQKTYETPFTAIAGTFTYVKPTKDGGYVLAGMAYDSISRLNDVYLIKTNNYGDTLWTKILGGQFEDQAWSVLQTSDNGYIVSGVHYPNRINSGRSALMVKLNAIGNTLWIRTIGQPGTGLIPMIAGNGVAEADDNSGYVLCGSYYNSNQAWNDIFLVKVSPDGNLLWTKTFDGGGEDFGTSIQKTTDGGFIVTGTIHHERSFDIALIKTDSGGNLLWVKAFGEGETEATGYCVQQTNDGGYIIAGQTPSFGAGYYDAFLVKTDSNGNAIWKKTYGIPDHDSGNSVVQTKDGDYILCGYTGWYGPDGSDVSLIRTDSIGNIKWSKAIGGSRREWGHCLQQTSDNGYIVAGFTYSFGNNPFSDAYLIKIDSSGNSDCYEKNVALITTTPAMQQVTPVLIVTSVVIVFHKPVFPEFGGGSSRTICLVTGITGLRGEENSISIFPNPLSSNATISFSLRKSGNVSLRIYDIAGRLVKILLDHSPYQPGNISIVWNAGDVSAGVYLLKMQSGEIIQTKKFIVVR